MKPFQILGKYVPNYSDPSWYVIFKDNRLYWEQRRPEQTRRIASHGYSITNDWHQDGHGGPPGIILWSNEHPTEVLLPNGAIVSGEPNDVILIDNKAAYHRTPPLYVFDRDVVDRYFVRAIVRFYISSIDIDGWKQHLSVTTEG